MAEWQDLYYRATDGLTLFARDYPAPHEGAPVALLMHGLTRNSADFEGIAPLLAQTHRLLVVDQRGRGNSDRDSDIGHYQLANYVADMFELLDQQGIARVAAIGTSMGGLMAMVMNTARPDLFSHVVINDIGPVLATEGLDRIKSYVGLGSRFADWDAAAEHVRTINEVAFPDNTHDDWLAFARRTCKEDAGEVVLNYDLGISEAMRTSEEGTVPPDLWPLFDALQPLPTLLVRGSITDLLDEPTTTEMKRRHPAMGVIEVPRVGHAPMLTEAGVAEQIADFINDR